VTRACPPRPTAARHRRRAHRGARVGRRGPYHGSRPRTRGLLAEATGLTGRRRRFSTAQERARVAVRQGHRLGPAQDRGTRPHPCPAADGHAAHRCHLPLQPRPRAPRHLGPRRAPLSRAASGASARPRERGRAFPPDLNRTHLTALIAGRHEVLSRSCCRGVARVEHRAQRMRAPRRNHRPARPASTRCREGRSPLRSVVCPSGIRPAFDCGPPGSR
jgi:hypothetical protein